MIVEKLLLLDNVEEVLLDLSVEAQKLLESTLGKEAEQDEEDGEEHACSENYTCFAWTERNMAHGEDQPRLAALRLRQLLLSSVHKPLRRARAARNDGGTMLFQSASKAWRMQHQVCSPWRTPGEPLRWQ